MVEIPPFNNTLHLHAPFNLGFRFRLENKMLHLYLYLYFAQTGMTISPKKKVEAINSRRRQEEEINLYD